MKLYPNRVFRQLILYKTVFSNIFAFQAGQHFKQSKMVVSWHYPSSSKLCANSHLGTTSNSPFTYKSILEQLTKLVLKGTSGRKKVKLK